MSLDTKSPLLEKDVKDIKRPDYSDREELYLKGLRKKMENARNARDKQHDEFDGMDYNTYYQANERAANTFIKPKKNREDSNFQSGTIRTKLFALLSPIVNLNLAGDISAFDKEGLAVQGMGDAMEDVILKTNELDGDDEKKYIRHYELLKHGTIFVEEIWDERMKKVKTGPKFNGKVKGLTFNSRIKKAFSKPSRNLIPGLNVYLGDMTKYDVSEQPFIFTIDTMPYEQAKVIFGEWERWENVSRKIINFDSKQDNILYGDWRLIERRENRVEIIRYQDKWNNEFAIIINGILMTPIDMPLPWGYENYNIVQQNLEPIHSKFAYGKSLVARIRNKVALLDEMMRLGILKTQKSFKPPYLNISGRILSNRVLMPGKITHGVAPGTLVPISDKETEGVTNAELNWIKEMQESINSETTSPTFQGQQARGNPTATEILELQRQAKQMLGLTIFSIAMLEWKLEWLRLQNLLKHWFNKQDTIMDEVRGVLKDQFRVISVERNIEGEGQGRRLVIPTKEIPSSEAIRTAEDALSKEQNIPIRMIFLKPEEVTSSKLMWQIVVRPKEKNTSEMAKLMFRAEIQDAAAIFGPTLNLEYLQERFASVWNEDPKKLFKKQEQVEQNEKGEPVSPGVDIPTPQNMANKGIGASLAG